MEGKTIECSYCSKERDLEKSPYGYHYCDCCQSAKCYKCEDYVSLDGRGVIAYGMGSRYEGFFRGGKRNGRGRWIINGLAGN